MSPSDPPNRVMLDRLIGNFRWTIARANDSDNVATVGDGSVVFR